VADTSQQQGASMSETALKRYEAPLLEPTTRSQESWEGWLTLDNLDAVAARIRGLLTGQRYTFVAVTGLFGFRPEVRTGNRLNGDLRVTRDGDYGHIVWSDSRYVTGIHTSVQTQDEAQLQAEDPSKRRLLTRVAFEPTFRDYGQFEVEQTTGAGERLFWTIAVEHTEASDA
jgi:hypothetical protein